MGSRAADTNPDKAATSGKDKRSTKQDSPASQKITTRQPKSNPGTTKADKAALLKSDLDALEVRLARADTITRDSVASLESVVSALQASLKTNTTTQKGQLTRQVNRITKRLQDQSAKTRVMVREELKVALSQGGMENFDEAIDRVSEKMDAAEIAQAEAIARINRHLADLARAVDARFQKEAQAYKTSLDTVGRNLANAIELSRSEVDARVARVERDSADALTKVGETIELVHDRLETRRQSSSDVVTEKVNELALQTQTELESYQARLDARLEEAEARQLAVGTGAAQRVVEKAAEQIDHKLDGLQKRLIELEALERALASAPEAKPETQPETDPQTKPVLKTPSGPAAAIPTMPALATAAQTQPLPPNPIQHLQDRLGMPNAAHGSTGPAGGFNQNNAEMDNPYAAALQDNGTAPHQPPAQAQHFPVAFNPSTASSQATPQTSDILAFPVSPGGSKHPPLPPFQPPQSLHAPKPSQAPHQPQTYSTSQNPSSAQPFQPPHPSGTQNASLQGVNQAPMTAPIDFETAPLPDAVYANPAYAEAREPVAVRVANETPPRKLSGRLPPVNGRTLRIALLATAVTVLALMAGRLIIGSGSTPDVTTTPNAQAEPNVENVDMLSIAPLTSAMSEPLGNYAEQAPILLDDTKLDTLEAAVDAGNPIAQFQMGLAKLDAGETDAGADLIRQAASANQPAALYRLAKLYETGDGVSQDDAMARQLIERAARGGNRIAMHDLALYYAEGRGDVAMDMQAAKSWFEQAAQRGVVDSQFNLAVLSESTETSTSPDQAEALFWYSVAASQGDQFAITRRDTLRAALSEAQLAVIDARIENFTPRAIDDAANGIFNDVPWIGQTTGRLNEQVRQVQTLLASLGYAVGTADGVMGQRTRNAIVEFERENGLSASGTINADLLQRLANAANA